MMTKLIKKIAPSILSSDFSRLQEEISAVQKAGADLVHIDIMDGHFVPNLTMGPAIVKSIRKCTDLDFDCHLMVEAPQKYIKSFKEAGAQMISVHVEATSPQTLKEIRSMGLKAGAAINPESPLEKLESFLPLADYVLVMGVHPGFSGQSYIETTPDRVKKLFDLRKQKKLSFDIEVDGGLTIENIEQVSQAGATIFVAGHGIFKTKDYQKTVSIMRKKING